MPSQTPQSNVEQYLSVIAGHGGEIPGEPASRVEYYLNEIVEEGGIGGKLRPEIVSSLPQTGVTGLLYLVPVQDSSGQNTHDEYIWIEEESKFELLGQTRIEVDLSGLVPDTRRVGGVPLLADVPVSLTGDSAITVTNIGTASAIGYNITLNDSGVTAGSKGNATNQKPDFGDTFKTLSATVDAKGRLTALNERDVTIPSGAATTSAAGLMSAADKNKLDNIIDATLSNVGQAADAKVTGDAFAALRNYLASMEVYRTASGNPATFGNGKDANLKDIAVTITPTQSGSGDPSPTNVRPISGVSSVTVTRTGKNLLPATAWNKTLRQNENYTLSVLSDGAILVDGYIAADNVLIHNMFDEMANSANGQHDYKKWLPNGQYTLYAEHDGNADVRLQVVTYFDTSNRTLITGNSPQNGALNFTITDQYPYNYARLFIAAGTYQNLKIYPRVYPADFDADSFELYQGQSATVSLADSNANPLTVFGGTLDVTTGTLVVNVFYTQILSADNALVYNSAYSPQLRRAGFPVNMRNPSAGYCSHFKPYAGGFANIPNMSVLGASTTIGLRNDALTSLDAWKAWLKAQEDAGTPLQVAWPISAPATYQLTPAQLAALSGYNAVSSDAGNVAVTYRADTSLLLSGGVS